MSRTAFQLCFSSAFISRPVLYRHCRNPLVSRRRPTTTHVATRRQFQPLCSGGTSSQIRAAQGGTLYVVSTPIGHVGDMSRRATHILQTVDMILAEDTRKTRTLLNLISATTRTEMTTDTSNNQQKVKAEEEHNATAATKVARTTLQTHSLSHLHSSSSSPSASSPPTHRPPSSSHEQKKQQHQQRQTEQHASPLKKQPTLLSCHDHNMRARIPQVLNQLSSGFSAALVCDAGTPCVSDPGYELITAVAARTDMRVVPIPGPSALLAALVGSATPSASFTFVGFLPRSGSDTLRLQPIVKCPPHTVVLYEAPHRLRATLSLLYSGPRAVRSRGVVIAREVTKKYEEFLRFDDAGQACRYYDNVDPRGEFTLVLGPPAPLPAIPSLSVVDAGGAVQKTDGDSMQEEERSNEHEDGGGGESDENVAEIVFEKYVDMSDGGAQVDVKKLVDSLVEHRVSVNSIAKSVATACGIPKKIVYAYANHVKQQQQQQ